MTEQNEERRKKVKDHVVEGLEGQIHTVTRYGSFMFQGITKFLYADAYDACKEYVSNAADAEAKMVRINCVPPDYDTMIVVDNGKGMSEEELHKALDIYISDKREKWNEKHPSIGHFGVGIYAGTMLCECIRIRTKQKNDPYILELTIPVKRWLEESEVGYDLKLEDVLHYAVNRVEASPSLQEKSFTSVILEGMDERIRSTFKTNRPDLFSKQLSMLTPIGFQPNLALERTRMDPNHDQNVISETWDFSDYIENVLNGKFGNSLHGQYNNVRLFVNGTEIHRPHPDDPISKKHVFETSFKIGDTIAGIGWAVAKGPAKKKKVRHYAVFDDPVFQGIDVRLLNVPIYRGLDIYGLVGITTADMPYRNIWGEIYLFHPTLQATLPRRNIKDCSEWVEVKKQIRDWLDNILNAVERARRPPVKKRPQKVESQKASSPVVASQESQPKSGETSAQGELIEQVEITGSRTPVHIGPSIESNKKTLEISDEDLPLARFSEREQEIIRVMLERILELGIKREELLGIFSILREILTREV